MSLDRASAMESLKRVLSLYRMAESEAAEYVNTIIEACSWMEPYPFDEACKDVVKEANPRYRPTPPQFIAFYHKRQDAISNRFKAPQAPRRETQEEKQERELRMMEEIITFTPQKAKSIFPFARLLRGIVYSDEMLEYLENLAQQPDK